MPAPASNSLAAGAMVAEDRKQTVMAGSHGEFRAHTGKPREHAPVALLGGPPTPNDCAGTLLPAAARLELEFRSSSGDKSTRL